MKEININLKNKSGVYIITNLVNGNRYIGSSNNIYERLKYHLRELENSIHSNKYLQNSWNKYKNENFEYGILELCEESKRLELEKFYVDIINPEYNLNGVCEGSILNHCEETKIKISNSVKQSYKSGKLKNKIDNANCNKYDCYMYSTKSWKLIKHFDSLAEASLYICKSKFDLRLEQLGSRLYQKEFVFLREKIDDIITLKNIICKTVFKYISKNLKEDKYLICEVNNERYYFRTIQELLDFTKCGSKSTISKHSNATKENPYIIKNTNFKVYFSYNFIPYEGRPIEESIGLLEGKIGEGCDANTEVSSGITKGSETPQSIEGE